VWDLAWRRGIFAWEMEQVSQLLGVVQFSSSSHDIKDKWVWKDGGNTIQLTARVVF